MGDKTRELIEAFDIEQWFEREGRDYKLSRGASGMQINAKECPACGDRRWRTYLNAETGRGNCFVCNETFNKLTFIHWSLGNDPKDGKGWRETFKHVREALGEQGWRAPRRSEPAMDPGKVDLPASFPLPTPDGQNLVYLRNRGVNDELTRHFRLRFCNEGRFWFTRDDGTKGWQVFDGRVIIPVYDLDDKLVTFQGRDVTGANEDQKYLFPKGLPGTGRYLYNGQSVRAARRVVMGEGAFDVIALKRALDKDATLADVVPIGSFGKHLSGGAVDGNDQLGAFIRLKRRGLEEVTIMWDGEPKALIAALDAADLLVRIGLRARIALLPAETDPNEVALAVVRDAFRKAETFTNLLSMKWRLSNPYAEL